MDVAVLEKAQSPSWLEAVQADLRELSSFRVRTRTIRRRVLSGRIPLLAGVQTMSHDCELCSASDWCLLTMQGSLNGPPFTDSSAQKQQHHSGARYTES